MTDPLCRSSTAGEPRPNPSTTTLTPTLDGYVGIDILFNPNLRKQNPLSNSLPKLVTEAKKSYASSIVNHILIPASEAVVTDDGDSPTVRISQAAFDKRVQLCSHSLIGRLILRKGDAPWKIDDLKLKLAQLWGFKDGWRLISIGKGYFHILLPSHESKQLVWSRGVQSLKPGIFRLQAWTPDFDPNNQKTTTPQVWVQILDLPWVYWDPVILADIAKCIGGLLRFDNVTLQSDYGHYARMLLDVDLSRKLPNIIGIEREGKKIKVRVSYEGLPSFCKVCSSVGHMAYQCRRNKTMEDADFKKKQAVHEGLRGQNRNVVNVKENQPHPRTKSPIREVQNHTTVQVHQVMSRIPTDLGLHLPNLVTRTTNENNHVEIDKPADDVSPLALHNSFSKLLDDAVDLVPETPSSDCDDEIEIDPPTKSPTWANLAEEEDEETDEVVQDTWERKTGLSPIVQVVNRMEEDKTTPSIVDPIENSKSLAGSNIEGRDNNMNFTGNAVQEDEIHGDPILKKHC
ncbi:hypothetical protein M5689_000823 [Euphorbia peplus]|nr:hypothetical protein M5689_000823 [Euphorbia peplus]